MKHNDLVLLAPKMPERRELSAEGGEGLLNRKGQWSASETAAPLFCSPKGGQQQGDQRVGSLHPGGQRHQARARDSGQTDGTAHGARGAICRLLGRAGSGADSGLVCGWLQMAGSTAPTRQAGGWGQHRLHFQVIVIFDLWDLRGHWSSILEPLTSNLWAIFMASKHCPLIELIEICIWFVGKGHGLTARMCSAVVCRLLPSPPLFPLPARKCACK